MTVAPYLRGVVSRRTLAAAVRPSILRQPIAARQLPLRRPASTSTPASAPTTAATSTASTTTAAPSPATTSTASATSSSSTASSSAPGFKATLLTTGALTAILVGYYYATDTRASLLHQYIIPPLIRTVFPDAEDAHHVGVDLLKATYSFGLHPRERQLDNGDLAVKVFGHTLSNPIGISAGLDKDAEIPDALFALGAGVVEVGGCTPLPQEGNPKPRVFRIPAVEGLINRYGLNSRGADAMAARLRERLRVFARRWGLTEEEVLAGDEVTGVPVGSLQPGRLLCVQVAKNKKTDEKDVAAVVRDYVACVQRLAPYADVLVVNVSSPNTPGLRDLQASGPLTDLLGAVVDEAGRATVGAGLRKERPRVMVKVSPDEDDEAQMEGVVRAVWASGVDGVIVGNTTKRRDVVPQGVKLTSKETKNLAEEGGFSGPAMFDRTLALVGRYRKMLDGHSLHQGESETVAVEQKKGTDEQKVIFATGGITTGEQALKVLNAGASVAMVYTGMVYGGSGTVTRMKNEMRSKLIEEKKN